MLVGDDCLDVYKYGTVDRLSPEAPVPVFKFTHEETRPGMASNVKENLLALGCEVNYQHGDKSCIKTRLIDGRSRQHIVRIDVDEQSSPIAINENCFENCDAVVISDYNKGAVSYELIEKIIKDFSGPIFIDTKKPDLSRFHGAFVKINEQEYNQRYSINSSLIVTLGHRGAMYKTKRDPSGETYFTAPTVEVSDVTGAGDTFLSALAYAYCQSQDIHRSIEFAIQASSITVQHLGVYAPRLEELQ